MSGRILIVEDDAAMRYAISRALEMDGFAVEVAVDGEAGVLAARASEYDVVLLDWMLPKLSGIDVCRVLRGESPVAIRGSPSRRARTRGEPVLPRVKPQGA